MCGGTWRVTENCYCKTFCPRRAAEGRGELQLQKGDCRRATATFLSAEGGGELQLQEVLATKGHEEYYLLFT